MYLHTKHHSIKFNMQTQTYVDLHSFIYHLLWLFRILLIRQFWQMFLYNDHKTDQQLL